MHGRGIRLLLETWHGPVLVTPAGKHITLEVNDNVPYLLDGPEQLPALPAVPQVTHQHQTHSPPEQAVKLQINGGKTGTANLILLTGSLSSLNKTKPKGRKPTQRRSKPSQIVKVMGCLRP